MGLKLSQLLPDAHSFQVVFNCPTCRETNRLPWYVGVTLSMISVFATLCATVATASLLSRYGLWPQAWSLWLFIGATGAVLPLIAVLLVRLYMGLVRQPFVGPRSRRTG